MTRTDSPFSDWIARSERRQTVKARETAQDRADHRDIIEVLEQRSRDAADRRIVANGGIGPSR